MDEVLFRLYYCYDKTGQTASADSAKSALQKNYAGSKYVPILTRATGPGTNSMRAEATRTYEDIYAMFLEGKFQEAIDLKKEADEKYGKTYWNPQLLYIEAVYYIRQREDSTAKEILNAIIEKKDSAGALAEKATTMLDVLNRRAQIEEELRNLQVEPRADTSAAVTDSSQIITRVPPRQPLANGNQQAQQIKPDDRKAISQPIDTVNSKPVVKINNNYSYNPTLPQFAVVVLNKVDIVFGNEAKNAFFRYNRQKFYNKQIELNVIDIDSTDKFLLVGPFPNEEEAMKYLETVRPVATTEIVPWLKPDKYSFSIISEVNLEILKADPDLKKYNRFLEQYLPGKF
jgi:tetratricopeptide (TPR) repeat protein